VVLHGIYGRYISAMIRISLVVLAVAVSAHEYSKFRSLFSETVDDNRFYDKNIDQIKEEMTPISNFVESRDVRKICDPSSRKRLDAIIETLRKDRQDIAQKRLNFFNNAGIVSKSLVYLWFGDQYGKYIEMEKKYKETEELSRKTRSEIEQVCS